MRPLINHFTDTDLYKLTMCCCVLDNYPRAVVKYEFKDRNNTIYPSGFDKLVKEQIGYLEDLRFSEREEEFMKSRCYYIPEWFYTYLRGYRFKSSEVKVEQDNEGHLKIEFNGYWHRTILLEVMVLAIVSELYHESIGTFDKINVQEYYLLSRSKASKLLEAGVRFSEFGTRRRFGFSTQELAVRAFCDESNENPNYPGKFVGTSNVYLAMEYNLTPIGTCAHEMICGIAGMYGPLEANNLAMSAWQKTYNGALGIYLYDTYGFEAFSNNFSELYARLYSGLRVDSGDNLDQLEKIINKYKSLGIDPKTKQIVFSNALNTESAIELHDRVQDRMMDSYGIGTHFTADGSYWDIKPLNIVIKLLSIGMTEKRFMSDTCKMSEDLGKYTGNEECINIFKKLLHIS